MERIYETAASAVMIEELIGFSSDWEKENCTYGYRTNTREDIEGRRIFLAEEDGRTVGYLFGKTERSENMRSVITFDKGGTWEFLQAPAFTEYGEKINCEV